MKRNGSKVTTPFLQRPTLAYSSQGRPNACCSSDTPHMHDVACFSALLRSATRIDRCIDPIPVMTDNYRKRCSSSSTCTEHSICATYASPIPLLRIEISKDEGLRTVLWSGPPLEVWEQGELFSLRGRTSTHGCRS